MKENNTLPINIISAKILELKPSVTLQITAQANEMTKRGDLVINLGAGEPDFNTADNVKTAAIQAIRNNFTRYTPATGILELKEAIAQKFKKFNKLSYQPDNICISCGAKHSIFNILQVILNAKDEVLIPSPYWVSYPAQVLILGGVPQYISTDSNYKLQPDILEDHISKSSKALILNYPSNPTGMTYTKKELSKIADIILENNIIVISDEVYEYFTYDAKEHTSFASLSDEVYTKTVTISSLSKTYAMTGWRIGYTACVNELSKAISKIQSHSTSNPTSIAQKAAVEALNGPQNQVEMMVKAFDKRRKYVTSRLNEIEGITCLKPEGAFYAFPDISALKIPPYKFTSQLLTDQLVALIPGESFGADQNIRISYAASFKDLEEGLDRIENFCSNLT